MKNKIIMIVISLLMINCYASALSARKKSGKDDRPQWLVNPHSQYPEATYMVAIGEGDRRGSAEANAAGNLARIFQSDIKTEELFQERYEEIASLTSAEAQTTTNIDKNIHISSQQTLFNIQFADSYTDNMGRVFVLAYIHRQKTGIIYVDKINKQAESVLFFRDKAESAISNLKKYAYLSAASVIATSNEVLLEQLNILSPAHIGMLELGYVYDDLSLETRKAAQNISFSIAVKNDKDNKIFDILSDVLTGNHFIVTNNGDLTLNADITIEDVDLERKEKFVRWYLTVNLLDLNDETIITHSNRGREGHINQPEAEARAFRAMESEIRKVFNRKIFTYLDGLVK